MPIVTCSCGAKLNVAAAKMGTTRKCPQCGESIEFTADSIKSIMSKDAESDKSSEEKPRTDHSLNWFCPRCNEQNSVAFFVCLKCRAPRPKELNSPATSTSRRRPRSWDYSEFSTNISGLASLITILGVINIIGGLITVLVGLNALGTLAAISLGLTAAISGIFLLGFGSVIEYLAKIEQHLRIRRFSKDG